MPEGDTIYRAARAQHAALAGKTITAVWTRDQRLGRMLPARLSGQQVDRVESRGKHLLHWFAPSGLALHTHMLMTGSWHVYAADARWGKPKRQATLTLSTSTTISVGFNVPVVELLGPEQVRHHRQLSQLGPDPLSGGPGGAVDLAEARRLMDLRPDRDIGVALLDQRVIAGIGNVYKNELLFIHRVDPWTPVKDVPGVVRNALLTSGAALLQANIAHGGTGRITTRPPAAVARVRGAAADNSSVFVYGKASRPCPRCDTPIRQAAQGDHARVTFWCPKCQGPGSARRRAGTVPKENLEKNASEPVTPTS